MPPTSVILNLHNQAFVSQQSQQKATTKTQIINEALDFYRKHLIKKNLMECFSEQNEEEVAEATSDFEDYLSLVKSNE